MDWSLFPLTTRWDGKRLQIGDCQVSDLVDVHGTPLYLYDAATVRGHVQELKQLLRKYYSGEAVVTYAAKAYFAPALARHLAAWGIGVDVVSQGELQVALSAGFSPSVIHLHGNNKAEDEIVTALDVGVQAIVVDSLDELEWVEQIAHARQCRARIWLRITPGIAAHTHPHIQTAHAQSKFGLYLETGEALEAIRKARASRWLHLRGLHTHLGSQIFEVEPYREAIEALFALAKQADYVPEELSPGGGWGVRYRPDDPPDDPTPWIRAVSESVMQGCERYCWPLPRLVIEPGRWLIARAGVAIYRVGSQKRSVDGVQIIAVDGGMADNPRVALYGARYTALPLGYEGFAGEYHPSRVVGRFCESGDVLIEAIDLPPLRRGDLLAVPVAGAYHLSMASNYNMVGRPAVLWLEEGRTEVLQPREDVFGTPWWKG
ncbi:diaminopimelate decarboxylase [Thermanaerothrix sp.]|uniref:diaminopimelate decarboxylase n=1 Tax=Thermanaerothrix sp. TaxID=2972675 RepID=UPI002ADDB093|nr:diaminopimelate decarboxylase [Thermanaerothrix sp.]